MMSLQIVDTDAFLEMPLSTQALYFHLIMRADDEGFVSGPKRVLKLINAQDDDLKILIAKRFLLEFESGVVVIKHWLIHNTIRMDRFNKTNYVKEKSLLTLKENKSYTERMATKWQPIDTHLAPQVKLSKAKLSKVNNKLSINSEPSSLDQEALIKEIFKTFYDNGNKGINFGNKTEREAAKWLLKEYGLEKTINTIKFALSIAGKQYAPVITTPFQLKNNMAKLIAYYKREQEPKKGVVPNFNF